MIFTSKRFFAIGALCLSCLAQAASAQDVTAELPPEVRSLLQKEMLQIDAAMKVIHGSIVRGEHEVVEKQGKAIHDSFILQQSITPEGRKALKNAVPEGFLQLDQGFHALAAQLSDSGGREDTAAQLKIFGQLTQACVTCHSRYVSERFDGLDAQ
ncbi:cytochrome c [Kineobactrum salinum]|uniref:Cytochrome c n=1 Tax=Kineobactrum salinum TaxID=2708301 RepID=A0A6C0U7U2_9GAMM|nr:cytochrome c [Kineobactrum salinum]QIB66535.1 cytochrome c [Kineobactrum salinum]